MVGASGFGNSRGPTECPPCRVRCGLYIVDVVVQPVPGRVPLADGQQAVLVRKLDALDHVSQRQLVAAVAGGGQAEQLRRGDVGDGELVLRVARALLPVQPLGLVEEGIAQGRRVAVDARVTLLSGRGYEVSVIVARALGDTWTREDERMRGLTASVYVRMQNKARQRGAGGSKTRSCGPQDRLGKGLHRRAPGSGGQPSGKTR